RGRSEGCIRGEPLRTARKRDRLSGGRVVQAENEGLRAGVRTVDHQEVEARGGGIGGTDSSRRETAHVLGTVGTECADRCTWPHLGRELLVKLYHDRHRRGERTCIERPDRLRRRGHVLEGRFSLFSLFSKRDLVNRRLGRLLADR